MSYSLEEIQAAFDGYRRAAAEAGATGDWQGFADCFTEDVHYIEHHYGVFEGRKAVLDWVTEAMTSWPMTHMTSFPWDWHTIDVDRGWVVGQVANVMVDPGDGETYQAANWTRLVYAGDGLFSEEEDVYNPAEFAGMVGAWMAVWKRHHPGGATARQ